jgi:hypothetical protein
MNAHGNSRSSGQLIEDTKKLLSSIKIASSYLPTRHMQKNFFIDAVERLDKEFSRDKSIENLQGILAKAADLNQQLERIEREIRGCWQRAGEYNRLLHLLPENYPERKRFDKYAQQLMQRLESGSWNYGYFNERYLWLKEIVDPIIEEQKKERRRNRPE